MAAIPEPCLDRLRAAGLSVSEPFVSSHVAFPDGVMVVKPASVDGHSLPGLLEASDGFLDAPGLYLHCADGKWFVTSHDFIPGPGPGDFVNEWSSQEDAVADIIDFYFASQTRMEIKRKARLSSG